MLNSTSIKVFEWVSLCITNRSVFRCYHLRLAEPVIDFGVTNIMPFAVEVPIAQRFISIFNLFESEVVMNWWFRRIELKGWCGDGLLVLVDCSGSRALVSWVHHCLKFGNFFGEYLYDLIFLLVLLWEFLILPLFEAL